jgi:DNA-binding NarL/FixJ family response regulator
VSKLRVFVVDDHPVVRDGLRTLIDAAPDMAVVGEAFDGETAVREAIELRPDAVVMDVSMPGMSGLEATARIRQNCPEVRVVALTAHEDRGYLKELLAVGATGYVLKRTAAEGLVRAIRCAAAGETYLDPAVAEQVAAGAPEEPEPVRAELSEREVEVLRLIAEGFLNKQIAARMGISVETVETDKARAMEKLGAKSRVDVVRYAAQRGWLKG